MSNTEYLGFTLEIEDDGEDHAEYIVRDADNEWVGSIDRWFHDRGSQFSPCFKRGATHSWTFHLHWDYVLDEEDSRMDIDRIRTLTGSLDHEASAFKTWRSAFKAFVGWAVGERDAALLAALAEQEVVA